MCSWTRLPCGRRCLGPTGFAVLLVQGILCPLHLGWVGATSGQPQSVLDAQNRGPTRAGTAWLPVWLCELCCSWRVHLPRLLTELCAPDHEHMQDKAATCLWEPTGARVSQDTPVGRRAPPARAPLGPLIRPGSLPQRARVPAHRLLGLLPLLPVWLRTAS